MRHILQSDEFSLNGPPLITPDSGNIFKHHSVMPGILVLRAGLGLDQETPGYNTEIPEKIMTPDKSNIVNLRTIYLNK